MKYLHTFRFTKINRYRFFPTVEGLEIQRIGVVSCRWHITRHVSARRGIFDLDYFSAKISKVESSEGSGTKLRYSEDTDAVQRTFSMCLFGQV